MRDVITANEREEGNTFAQKKKRKGKKGRNVKTIM